MSKPRESFKTPKGTTLPLLNLKNKEYLQVAHRLVWLAEETTYYDITTEILPQSEQEKSEEAVTVKAVISILEKDPAGRFMVIKKVNAMKTEHRKHFADHKEKAETGAIGRALALLGYGTQYTGDELDEGERIVDSPTIAAVKQKTSSFRKSDNVGVQDDSI